MKIRVMDRSSIFKWINERNWNSETEVKESSKGKDGVEKCSQRLQAQREKGK